ncbi:IS982 family transposase [Streptomyces sp. NPDC001443]
MLTPVKAGGSRNQRTPRANRTEDASAVQGPLYRLADYLEQKGRRERAEQIPPIDFWTAAAAHAHRADLAMLGFTSEARWLRHARAHLRHLFPYLPQQPGYNKRLRKAAELLRRITRILAGSTSVWSDDVWIVDSTPVECGRSRETVKRSDLAGWAQYGYCASHSRFFWGLRLHLVCTLQGLPVAFALTGAKADERETLLDLLAAEPHLIAARSGQTLIGDKNYFGRTFEQELAQQDIQLLRPTRKGERQRPGGSLFKPLRQVIESVNETFKGQLSLEQHRGRTPRGVIARVMQRILALTAAIWHNDYTGQSTLRSLTSYDH